MNGENNQSYYDCCVDMSVELLDYMLYEQSINDFDQDKAMDLMYERASNQADIYFTDLFRSVPAFCEYINDAIND